MMWDAREGEGECGLKEWGRGMAVKVRGEV